MKNGQYMDMNVSRYMLIKLSQQLDLLYKCQNLDEHKSNAQYIV